MIYHEIKAYKARTGVKIVVAMMDMATSGAYYISLPADHIVAHPTTITGSVATNDSDVDDGLDPASMVIATGPSHGTLVVNANGTVDYAHDGSENFTDGFTFAVRDEVGNTDTGSVLITINPVNDNAPVAGDETFTVDEGGTATETDLDGVVAVRRDGLDLRHDAGTGLDHRHRCHGPVFVEQLGHPEFSTDQSFDHLQPSVLERIKPDPVRMP